MPKSLKIIVETTSLDNASPAVISKIPMVYIEDIDISVKEILNQYITFDLHPFIRCYTTELDNLFNSLLLTILDFIKHPKNKVSSPYYLP